MIDKLKEEIQRLQEGFLADIQKRRNEGSGDVSYDAGFDMGAAYACDLILDKLALNPIPIVPATEEETQKFMDKLERTYREFFKKSE